MRHSSRNNGGFARWLVTPATVRTMGWREKILGDESLNFEISDGLVREKNSTMAGGIGDGEDRGMVRTMGWWHRRR